MSTDSILIAETFYSIKGEGPLTGRPMFFVRLAGCPLGRVQLASKAVPKVLNCRGNKAMICTNFDGQKFYCDTEYHSTRSMDINELYSIIRIHYLNNNRFNYLVITGGEPFVESNHKFLLRLEEKIVRDFQDPLKLYFETSGTQPVPPFRYKDRIFISCSPKEGYLYETLNQADEIRLTIGPKTRITHFIDYYSENPYIRLSPLSIGKDLDPKSLQRCLDILKEYPNWTLNVQLHKLLNIL
jgi:7-carboxy-7-deazaguanine synthase